MELCLRKSLSIRACKLVKVINKFRFKFSFFFDQYELKVSEVLTILLICPYTTNSFSWL